MSSGAATSLVRKGKLKEAEALIAEVAASSGSHVIAQFLDQNVRPQGVGAPYDFVQCNTLTSGAVTIMPEYNKKAKTGFIMGMPGPEIMGGVLRDAGARAVVVSMDRRSGGTSFDEFERFTREQTKARRLMPTPIPVVWHDFIVDPIQIAHAAALGAAGVTITPAFCSQEKNGKSDLGSLVAYAKKLGVEPIVQIDSVEQGHEAIAVGARCLCLQTLDEKQLVAARKALPSDKGILYIARLRPEEDFSSYAEIDTAWVLRDNGFNTIWPSPDAVYANGMGEVYTCVRALKSKASKEFLSPRQFLMDGKKEGAQEYLGDILY